MPNISFIPQTPPIYQTQLAFQLAPSDITATFASEAMIDGNLLSGLICVSVDIGQPNPEYIIGTLSGTTFTITLRNVAPLDPTTSIGAFASIHGQGAVVKITDFASIQLMRNILQGITPLQNPLISLAPAVNGTDVPNFAQLQAAVISGGLPASTTVMGISRISANPATTLGNPTISIASPAVVTFASHGLTANDIVQFTTTGALPTGLSVGVNYYVLSTGLTTNTFEVSTTAGGTAVNTSGTQSGTHTLIKETPVAVGVNDTRLPTQGENDALVGDNQDIVVGSGNTFITETGFQKNKEKYAIDNSGSSTAYTIALSPIPTSLSDGMIIYAKIINANTTTNPTLNVNGLGAKTIVKGVSTALAINDIAANQYCNFQYNGTNMVLLNPVTSTASVLTPSYSKVQTITFNSISVPTATITNLADFTGLAGDTDDIYLLIWELTSAGAVSATKGLGIRINADTGNNYIGTSATLGATYAGSATSAQSFAPVVSTTVNTQVFGDITFLAKTNGNNRNGIYRSQGVNASTETGSLSWTNSANQVTEITLVINQTSGSTQTYSGIVTLYKINR